MSYSVIFTERSRKQFSKLNKDIQVRIIEYLEKKVINSPLECGKSLTGNKKGLWRYRIGDYRVICNISNKQLLVLVIDIGHRKDVYK